MHHHPTLLAAGLERQATLSERISETLCKQVGLTELDAHVVAESFAVTIRLTLDEWVRRTDHGSSDLTLQKVYREVRASLIRITERRAL